MTVLREDHAALGALIHEFEGTSNASLATALALFDDPMPCPDPCLRGARTAWRGDAYQGARRPLARLGDTLGFGVGIVHRYATLGPSASRAAATIALLARS